MTQIMDPIYDEVYKKLKNQMEKDNDFKKELQYLYFFYERKLLAHARSEESLYLIKEDLEDVIFSQYFQGYYVMKTILVDDETNLVDSVWTLEQGVARNEIPTFVKNLFSQEQIDWTYTELGHKFGIDLLQILEPAFEVFKQLRIDIANFGAYKAFIDDARYVGPGTKAKSKNLLGSIHDIEFISPQVYMQAQFITSTHEILDLFNWASVNDNMWVGSATLSIMSVEEQTLYFLEIKLANTISREEKLDLTNEIIGKLPEDVRDILQTRLYHIEDMELLVKNKDLEEEKEEPAN